VPPVWGRDELGAGEMWNSNSLISWLIARSGLDVEAIQKVRYAEQLRRLLGHLSRESSMRDVGR
jgi:hypothetical protein